MSGDEKRIPTGAIAVYALPSVSMGFMSSLISFYLLKFSTDVLLLAPAVMGLLFGISKVWDAISDPLAGYWSDRTRSRLGRRRPWFLAAALPLSVVFVGLWSPPASLGASALAIWMGAGILLFYSAMTILNVPHASLGAELTLDHHDRTRVFAGRAILDMTGVLLAAGALFTLERAANPRDTATALALAAGLVSLGLILLTTARVRERPDFQGRGATRPYAAFSDVLRNPHARLLLAVFFLETLGFSAMITVFPYATEYDFLLPGMTSVFLAAALVVMGVTIPLWLPLSRRVGKRNLWALTMGIKALAFGGLLFAPVGVWLPLIVGVVVIGACHGCGMMVGPSIQADVIDYDELRTGQRKEGAYFATWNLALKLAGGGAIAFTGFLLQLSGFQANVVQSETTLWTMRLLFAGAPFVSYVIAALLLLRFSLNEREHAEVRETLRERQREQRAA
ncbi:MAG: MFS transporter [Proteobacteria bacterium]|nr:MFS transporter [Pseudomonadota bacterium]